MHQMVSLFQCGDGSAAAKVLRKRRVRDLVSQVESLYLPWNTAIGTAVSERIVGAGVANGVADPSLQGLSSSISYGGVATAAVVASTNGVPSTTSTMNNSE